MPLMMRKSTPHSAWDPAYLII